MPEKKNESKIMAMLERTGVIRKADSVEDSILDGRDDSGIKPIIDSGDEVKVTPAARQPIPGMPTPVFPSDKSADAVTPQSMYDESDYTEYEAEAEEDYEVDAAPVAPTYQPAYEPADNYEAEAPASAYSAPEVPVYEPVAASTSIPDPVAPPPQRAAPSFGGLNLFRNGRPQEEPPSPPYMPERAAQPENYTDRYLNTEELYDALALRSKKTESIYLVEDYLQTLPASLPDTQRRDIVNKLIEASGFDYDLLMGDGVLRVKMLKEYAERFARHTDDYIAARQAELDELDQQILRTRRLIENRKDLHKKQFFSIEAEAQRLKEILTFISG